MPRGGYRDGAGRKKGSANLLTQELRKKINAERLINFLQALADGRIKGATVGERMDAAIALLRKVVADLRNMEVKTEGDNEFKMIIEDYRESGNTCNKSSFNLRSPLSMIQGGRNGLW